MVDEIYQGLALRHGGPWTAFGLPGEVVLINSFSKYSPDDRLATGRVVLPEDSLRGFEKLAQHLFISAPACLRPSMPRSRPSNRRFIEGAGSSGEWSSQDAEISSVPALKKAGLSIPAEPHGAFYVYADPSAMRPRIRARAAGEAAAAATPGVDFGRNGTDRYVRFAYTRSMADLEEAARRLERFAASGP